MKCIVRQGLFLFTIGIFALLSCNRIELEILGIRLGKKQVYYETSSKRSRDMVMLYGVLDKPQEEKVLISLNKLPEGSPVQQAYLDSNGYFLMLVEQGDYEVKLSSQTGWSNTRVISISENRFIKGIHIILSSMSSDSISSLIINTNDSLQVKSNYWSLAVSNRKDNWYLNTIPKHKYVIELKPGEYELKSRLNGGVDRRGALSLSMGQQVVKELVTSSLEVQGMVRNSATSELIRNCWVRVESMDTARSKLVYVRAAPDGRFALNGIEKGRYKVQAIGKGVKKVDTVIVCMNNASWNLVTSSQFRGSCLASISVEGLNEVSGSVYSLVLSKKGEGEGDELFTASSAKGEFSINYLPPGVYEASLDDNWGNSYTSLFNHGEFEVREGDRLVSQVLKLDPHCSVLGTLSAEDGKPLSNISLKLKEYHGNELYYRDTDSLGQFVLSVIDSTTYTLSVSGNPMYHLDTTIDILPSKSEVFKFHARPEVIKTCDLRVSIDDEMADTSMLAIVLKYVNEDSLLSNPYSFIHRIQGREFVFKNIPRGFCRIHVLGAHGCKSIDLNLRSFKREEISVKHLK